jgi:hypothetical protein
MQTLRVPLIVVAFSIGGAAQTVVGSARVMCGEPSKYSYWENGAGPSPIVGAIIN